MVKKHSFKTDFGPFGQNLGLKRFFHGFYLCYMLDIVASYHCMQFQGNLMKQTWENTKNLVLGLILVHLAQIWAIKICFSKIWLCQSLAIMISYHHGQYQKKLITQSLENLVTDGRIDGQEEGSDFIGCSRTNVERPTIKNRLFKKYLKRGKLWVTFCLWLRFLHFSEEIWFKIIILLVHKVGKIETFWANFDPHFSNIWTAWGGK